MYLEGDGGRFAACFLLCRNPVVDDNVVVRIWEQAGDLGAGHVFPDGDNIDLAHFHVQCRGEHQPEKRRGMRKNPSRPARRSEKYSPHACGEYTF